MKTTRKKAIVTALVAIAVVAWALRGMGVLYIPGLTALALAAAMGIVGVTFLSQKGASKKIGGVLLIAYGLFNLLVGLVEIYSRIRGA